MSTREFIESIGDWKGYNVVHVERHGFSKGEHVTVELFPESGHEMHCGGCGTACSAVHEMTTRRIRDLSLFESKTWLLVPRRRLLCPSCGPKLERLEWLAPYARVTRRFAESVARLCRGVSVSFACKVYGIDWSTAKAIDKAAMEEELGPIDLSGLSELMMDEFAIQKGHRYATVFAEPHTRRVLWVGRGHTREAVRPFFELLGPERCAKIRAVAMDMSSAFSLEVQAWCPNAEIVYDQFHIVAKFGREVIDRVRVDEANRLRDDKAARKVVKTSRWLLLRNRENVPDKDKVRLKELLDANQALMTVYVLKDELKRLWTYRSKGWARKAWANWRDQAMESGIAPLKAFVVKLQPYLDGIIAHCRWPLNTSVLEGINNKIKVIKRVGYGYRDDDYFFLKVRAAFPGKS